MKNSPSRLNDFQASAVKYCDRCARRSMSLFYDDLSLQELCQDCCDRLKRKRDMTFRPVKPKI